MTLIFHCPLLTRPFSLASLSASTGTLALKKEAPILAAASLERRASRAHKDTRKRMLRLNMGAAQEDVHECVRCLRAIMNHQYGFHLIIGHRGALGAIALSLRHRECRTRSLVLELLAAVCLVDGGHAIVLAAFDHFKDTHGEAARFHTLMGYFRKDCGEPDFNIDFMVACMQFINIIGVCFRLFFSFLHYLLIKHAILFMGVGKFPSYKKT